MASERIINEYDSTRIANAVDTLATNLADYSGTTVTPTDAMKAKLPSQTTADRIADAVETLAENVTSLSDLVRASYEESPALYAHAIDDILYYNNKFYDVTSAIAIGDTLTVSSGLIVGNISERPGDMSYEVFGIPGGGSGGTVIADDVSYNNTSSGLNATKVQGAIDEVNSKLSTSIENLDIGTHLISAAYPLTLTRFGKLRILSYKGAKNLTTGSSYTQIATLNANDTPSKNIMVNNNFSGRSATVLVVRPTGVVDIQSENEATDYNQIQAIWVVS